MDNKTGFKLLWQQPATSIQKLMDHGYSVLPEDRSTKSLKSQWHNDLFQIVSKFADIVEMNPPNSCEQYDDMKS